MLADGSKWKKPFLSSNIITLEMPKNAKPISVGVQNKQICLWAEVSKKNELETREFYIFGTGAKCPENGTYIGTVMLFEQTGVFHIYSL